MGYLCIKFLDAEHVINIKNVCSATLKGNSITIKYNSRSETLDFEEPEKALEMFNSIIAAMK